MDPMHTGFNNSNNINIIIIEVGLLKEQKINKQNKQQTRMMWVSWLTLVHNILFPCSFFYLTQLYLQSPLKANVHNNNNNKVIIIIIITEPHTVIEALTRGAKTFITYNPNHLSSIPYKCIPLCAKYEEQSNSMSVWVQTLANLGLCIHRKSTVWVSAISPQCPSEAFWFQCRTWLILSSEL